MRRKGGKGQNLIWYRTPRISSGRGYGAEGQRLTSTTRQDKSHVCSPSVTYPTTPSTIGLIFVEISPALDIYNWYTFQLVPSLPYLSVCSAGVSGSGKKEHEITKKLKGNFWKRPLWQWEGQKKGKQWWELPGSGFVPWLPVGPWPMYQRLGIIVTIVPPS